MVRFLTLGDDVAAVAAGLRQPVEPVAEIERVVRTIVADVRAHGDDAVRAHVRRLDGYELPAAYAVPAAALTAARDGISGELRAALETAIENLRAYHLREMPVAWRETLAQGQVVGQEIVPVETAGLYVPGGLADYPSSLLMTAVPAQVAGVGRLVVCSPGRGDGRRHGDDPSV